MNFPILSSLILLPSIGALFLFFTKSDKKNNFTGKYVALFTSAVNFFLSIYLWILFDPTTSDFQFVEERIWIKDLINYKVGVDGISILFILLTTFITPLCIISVNNSIQLKVTLVKDACASISYNDPDVIKKLQGNMYAFVTPLETGYISINDEIEILWDLHIFLL